MQREDLVARYDGDEFSLVLNHANVRGDAILGQRV